MTDPKRKASNIIWQLIRDGHLSKSDYWWLIASALEASTPTITLAQPPVEQQQEIQPPIEVMGFLRNNEENDEQ